MNNEWQPIETAPTDGTDILAYDADGDVFVTWHKTGYKVQQGLWLSYSKMGYGDYENPLGWMPLPEAPK